MLSHSTPQGLGHWDGAGEDRSTVPGPGVWNAGTAGEGLSRSVPKVHARIDTHHWVQRRCGRVPTKLYSGEQKKRGWKQVAIPEIKNTGSVIE